MRPQILCTIGLLLAGLGGACGGSPQPAIVLVTIDSLRADHLSGYGYHQPTSPNLDRLMARGATFAWAFSTSSATAPSHASILTGRYVPFHSVGAFDGHYRLKEGLDTMAERLTREGFRTAAVVSSPVLKRGLGLDRGFEVYDGPSGEGERAERRADAAVDRAIALLEELRGSRFFLWLQLHDPHGPYDPPESALATLPAYEPGAELPVGADASGHHAIPSGRVFGDERSAGAYTRRYDGEIVFADAQLGRFFERLEHGTTLVVVTSDHGEALGEDGFYFAHSHSLGLEQVHVPLVLAGPGVPAGLWEERPVSNAWLFQTVLRFATGRLPGEPPRPGRDLFAAAEDGSRWIPEPALMASLSQVAVAHGRRFARRDSRPRHDAQFWSAKNPNTGGVWKPLGSQAVELGTWAETPLTPPSRKLLRRHLASLSSWPRRYLGEEQAREQIAVLRSLGYADGSSGRQTPVPPRPQ